VAQRSDRFSFTLGFRPEPMVDGGRFDLARTRGGSEEQQGKAVGSARHGNAKASSALGERIEAAAETVDQLGRGLQIRSDGGVDGSGHWIVLLGRFGDRQSILPRAIRIYLISAWHSEHGFKLSRR
jgi:hypothetical protein